MWHYRVDFKKCLRLFVTYVIGEMTLSLLLAVTLVSIVLVVIVIVVRHPMVAVVVVVAAIEVRSTLLQ